MRYMAEMHNYATSSRNRTTVFGAIAVISTIASIVTYYIFAIIANKVRPFIDIMAYGWLFAPISLTGYYGIFLRAFERYLWRYLTDIPDLGGVWVGFTHPNYQVFPHISTVKIAQSWLDMLVDISHFYPSDAIPNWHEDNILGLDKSFTAAISPPINTASQFVFTYQHKGNALKQGTFDGTMVLTVDISINTMFGTYYTNRPDEPCGKGCSYGHVILIKQEGAPISHQEIFRKFKNDGTMFSDLYTSVMVRAGRGGALEHFPIPVEY